MSEMPGRDEFAANKNTSFTIAFAPETAVEMELVEVSETREHGGTESFSLVFLAPPDAPVLQNVFPVEHKTLGRMDLFLVPVGRSERGVQYEAVFNRPSSSGPAIRECD